MLPSSKCQEYRCFQATNVRSTVESNYKKISTATGEQISGEFLGSICEVPTYIVYVLIERKFQEIFVRIKRKFQGVFFRIKRKFQEEFVRINRKFQEIFVRNKRKFQEVFVRNKGRFQESICQD